MISGVVLLGAGIGVGVVLATGGIWSVDAKPARRRWVKTIDRASLQAAVCAMVCAGSVGLITHWPVGAAVGGAAGWTLRSALQPNGSRRVIDRLEALASWIESLRDSVAAHRGLVAAIESTVGAAPPSLKPGIARLVARIRSGVALDQALLLFAEDIGDSAADEAVAPLVLAARFGGSDLQRILDSAAAATRDQIALWRRTEVARAKPRRDMRLVVAVTLVFTGGILVIGHGYFQPFDSPSGQLALLVVAGMFAAGFASMSRMSRPQPLPRLFQAGKNK